MEKDVKRRWSQTAPFQLQIASIWPDFFPGWPIQHSKNTTCLTAALQATSHGALTCHNYRPFGYLLNNLFGLKTIERPHYWHPVRGIHSSSLDFLYRASVMRTFGVLFVATLNNFLQTVGFPFIWDTMTLSIQNMPMAFWYTGSPPTFPM